MITWLMGKKTYIICIAGIIGSFGAYMSGGMSFADFITAALGFLAGMGLRNGIANK
jgi:hypothetical protein